MYASRRQKKKTKNQTRDIVNTALVLRMQSSVNVYAVMGANYKKILRLSYDVIITYDNRKSNLR